MNKPTSFKDTIDNYWTKHPELNRPSFRVVKLCSMDFENSFALAWADFVRYCQHEEVYPYDVPKRMVMGKLLTFNHGLGKCAGMQIIKNKIDKMFEEAEFGDIEW